MVSFRVYLALLSASARAQMSFRRSFWLEGMGRVFITGLEIVPIFFVFEHIESLRGWTRWEIVYLYGLASLTMGLGEMLTSGLDDMPVMVRRGEFDRLLLRPVSPLLQMLGRNIRLYHLGRVAQGAVAFGFALAHLDVSWSAGALAMLALSIVCGVALYGGLFVAGAANCFWTIESGEVFNAFTYGGVQVTQFPISIYRPWLRFVFLFIVPVGFVSYFPTLIVLDKSDPWGAPVSLAYLAPVVTLVFVGAVSLFWTIGVNRYQSTGS